MATSFYPGQTLGRTDLSIFLTDSDENPTNAYEITYALYYVDPGPPASEVLIGLAARTPVNPQVGEYYASLMVPPTAVEGTYRIRWTLKQYANSPSQEVVQEFTVVADAEATQVLYSSTVQGLIDSLRMALRDQCVGGEETVELDVDGERMVICMEDLWECLQMKPEQ